MLYLQAHSRVVAIDLETTGLFPVADRVVELGAVAWREGARGDSFAALVNPGRPIPPEATAVNGITDAMVREAPAAAEVLPAFLAFCHADLVVAHNAPFDLGFLRAECARQGLPLFPTPVVDTCELARWRFPDLPSYSLEALLPALGIRERQGGHRALADAEGCLEIFLRCVGGDVRAPQPGEESLQMADCLAIIREALASGGRVMIEYQDSRGRETRREIQPLLLDEEGLVVEAFCLLRKDTRHFYLARIRRAWRAEG